MRRSGLVLMVLGATLAAMAATPAPVAVIHGDDFTAYQGQSVTTWFSYWFQIGFLVSYEKKTDAIAAYERDVAEVGTLFATGIVRGEAFYDQQKMEYTANPPRLVINVSTGSVNRLPEMLTGFDGPIVKILNIERKATSADGTRRTYDLWTTFSKGETGWGCFDHYTLTVENPAWKKGMSREDFARGATLKALVYEGIEF